VAAAKEANLWESLQPPEISGYSSLAPFRSGYPFAGRRRPALSLLAIFAVEVSETPGSSFARERMRTMRIHYQGFTDSE